MEERRSSRKRERTFTVPENISEGLKEFVVSNKKEVAEMLDEEAKTEESVLVDRLVGVMGQQKLTPTTLLGRFFSAESLGKYCESKGKSPKGGIATLAARVAAIWEKSAPKSPKVNKKVSSSAADDAGKDEIKDPNTECQNEVSD
jgi:hypothetical protein